MVDVTYTSLLNKRSYVKAVGGSRGYLAFIWYLVYLSTSGMRSLMTKIDQQGIGEEKPE